MRADDHQIYVSGETMEGVKTQFVENKCNRDKFQSMSLRQRPLNEVMKIKVYENYVESGPEMKLLGVTFNEHLKFNSYLDERDRIMIELRVWVDLELRLS